MKVSIAIRDADGEMAGVLEVRLSFAPAYAVESLRQRKRIELKGVRAAEKWLRTLRASQEVGK